MTLDEAHDSRYPVHPGTDKMHFDQRKLHGDKSGKRTIGRIVSHCSAGLRVMFECHKSSVVKNRYDVGESSKDSLHAVKYKKWT